MWAQLGSRAVAPAPHPCPAQPEPTGLPGRTWTVSLCCLNRSLKKKTGGLLGGYQLKIHLPAFLFINDLRKLEMCPISFGRDKSKQNFP